VSTISTTINHGIYLEPSGYASPLTITADGAVKSSGNGTEGGAGQNDSAVYGSGTLINMGEIVGTDGDLGVTLLGGSIDNSGVISGNYVGILALDSSVSITNSGSILSTNDSNNFLGFRADIEIGYGGSFTNTASGYVNGGVSFLNENSSVNYSGTVINSGTITNDDGQGITLDEGGTVIDSGKISSSGGGNPAIYFGGTFYGDLPTTNLLDLEAGYSIQGGVRGSDIAGSTNTLELTGSVSSPVTVNFTPTSFTDFTEVEFAPGNANAAKLELATAADVPATIAGFTGPHDVIDLGFISDSGGNASATFNPETDTLTVTGDDGSTILQLDRSDVYSGLTFHATADGSGTDVTAACYAVGTLILTEHGEAAIETLRIGDRVMNLSGAARPIRWIGRRSYSRANVAGNRELLPIRIRAGALGFGIPRRNLRVSPGHAMWIDDMLIPARALTNGVSITQEEWADGVTYLHLEFDTHTLIYAEGAPAESFIDDESRGQFDNAEEYSMLYPQALRGPASSCGPRVEEGEVLEATRRRLATLAAQAADREWWATRKSSTLTQDSAPPQMDDHRPAVFPL